MALAEYTDGTAKINLALHGSLGCIGLFLNSIAIIIIVRGEKFGAGIKIQLLNLAIADILSSLVAAGVGYKGGHNELSYPDSIILCRLHQYIMHLVVCASLLGKTSISLERFVAVYFPLRMLRYQRRHVIMVVIFVWVVSAALHIDSLVEVRILEDVAANNSRFCIPAELQNSPFNITTSAITFLVPVFVIITCYGSICIKLCKRKRIGEQHKYSNESRNNQVILMLAVDALLALVTWTPYMVILLSPFGASEDLTEGYYTVAYAIIITNCFSTPVLYFIFNKDFKRDGMQIFSKLCCQRKSETTGPKSSSSNEKTKEVQNSNQLLLVPSTNSITSSNQLKVVVSTAH